MLYRPVNPGVQKIPVPVAQQIRGVQKVPVGMKTSESRRKPVNTRGCLRAFKKYRSVGLHHARGGVSQLHYVAVEVGARVRANQQMLYGVMLSEYSKAWLAKWRCQISRDDLDTSWT